MENETVFGKIKRFLQKWKEDYIFKTMASSVISFGVTVLFALYNGFLGVRLLSVWHGSICVFYLLLVAVRGMILWTEKNNTARMEDEKAHHTQRMFILSGVILLILNLALILPISMMVTFEKPVNMGMIPAITMATYTTYKITMASIHIRKQKRNSHRNVLVTELRTINFIDALVSVLTLQNTLIMVNQTQSDANDMRILSAISVAVIDLVIMIITVHLLVTGHKTEFKSNKK